MDYKEKYEKAVQAAILAKQNTESAVTIGILEDIFPELIESNDERIRKELIENFKWFCGDFPETTTWGKDDDLLVKDIIAWLEKQGTPAKLSEEEQNRLAKGVLTSCAMSFIDYLDAHKYEGKMCVSNGECEDIENAFHNAMWDRLHRYYCKYLEKKGEQNHTDELVEQNSAWSEEDEKKLLCICAWIKDYPRIADFKDEMYTVANNYIDWLNSLKDRVIPQPKQEWCEEDERRINHIIAFMSDKERIKDTETMFPIEEDIRWLKSLKERYTWKPSDEQMEELRKVFDDYSHGYEDSIIESLYYDLKHKL